MFPTNENCWFAITLHLPLQVVFRLQQLNHRLHRLLDHSYYWHQRSILEFGTVLPLWDGAQHRDAGGNISHREYVATHTRNLYGRLLTKTKDDLLPILAQRYQRVWRFVDHRIVLASPTANILYKGLYLAERKEFGDPCLLCSIDEVDSYPFNWDQPKLIVHRKHQESVSYQVLVYVATGRLSVERFPDPEVVTEEEAKQLPVPEKKEYTRYLRCQKEKLPTDYIRVIDDNYIYLFFDREVLNHVSYLCIDYGIGQQFNEYQFLEKIDSELEKKYYLDGAVNCYF